MGAAARLSCMCGCRVSSLTGMFSHPAAPPPPQRPQDSEVAGDPALDDRWAEAATAWRPEVRVGSRAQYSWLRWAWEQLGSRDDLLGPCLALLTAFLQVADGEALASASEAVGPDGDPLRSAEGADEVARRLAEQCGTTLCFAQLWSLARPEELQEDPWAEPDDQIQRGAGADVAGEEAAQRPLFPLSGDDIAWIVSGSMTAAKDRTWLWFSGIAAQPQG